MIKKVRERIRQKSQISERKKAVELGISRQSPQRIIIEYFGLKSYKKGKCHGLTDANKKTRVERSRELLRRHASGDHDGQVFSVE